MRRSSFSNARNSIFAGQTGTRSVGGWPQVRWEAGVVLAKQVNQLNSVSQRTKKLLSIGVRIRNAVQALRLGSLRINPSGSDLIGEGPNGSDV